MIRDSDDLNHLDGVVPLDAHVDDDFPVTTILLALDAEDSDSFRSCEFDQSALTEDRVTQASVPLRRSG